MRTGRFRGEITNFVNHRFKMFYFIKLSFIVSPINAMFEIVDIVVSAIIPSILVLATARFVEVAIGIKVGTYPIYYIYKPIGLLLLLLYVRI